ncbi:MAG: CPBP family intramembrane glutamic endopeptidase [Gemmatimonadota bacterium]
MSLTPAAPPRANSSRAIVRFFLCTFGITWAIQLPILLGQDGLGLFGYHLPLPLYFGLFLVAAFGPTAAAYLTLRTFEGTAGVKAWLQRFVRWRVGGKWFVVALLGYPVLHLIIALVLVGPTALSAVTGGWTKLFTMYLPAVLLFPALINWGEEPGWRGFALTQLETRMSPWQATLIVGTLHGLWHLPIFLLVSGPVAQGPFELSNFLFNTALIAVISIIWTWVYNSARQSILVATLLHASGNAGPNLIGSLVPSLPQHAGYVNAAAYAAIALFLLIGTKGRLGYAGDGGRAVGR